MVCLRAAVERFDLGRPMPSGRRVEHTNGSSATGLWSVRVWCPDGTAQTVTCRSFWAGTGSHRYDRRPALSGRCIAGLRAAMAAIKQCRWTVCSIRSTPRSPGRLVDGKVAVEPAIDRVLALLCQGG